jgi:hypothetical protein
VKDDDDGGMREGKEKAKGEKEKKREKKVKGDNRDIYSSFLPTRRIKK